MEHDYFNMLQFSQLKDITGGIVLQQATDSAIRDLIIDSRKAIINEASVFFAISGKRNNGHAFLDALYKSLLLKKTFFRIAIQTQIFLKSTHQLMHYKR